MNGLELLEELLKIPKEELDRPVFAYHTGSGVHMEDINIGLRASGESEAGNYPPCIMIYVS